MLRNEQYELASLKKTDLISALREEATLLKIAAIWIGFIIEHWADNSISTIGSPIG